MTSETKKHLFLLFLVAAVVLAAGLGLRDPWPADEPRFALIARDMAEGGNWLFPNVGGVLYPDKPPLFFWLVAVLYATIGSLRIAFLLPGLLAGLGTLWFTVDLARRVWDEKTAIWCGATLLALLQFPLQMKSGQIDGLLCFWTTLSLYGLCRHLLLGPDWRWYVIAGVAAGLGVITKGVGFLPYLVFIPHLFAARHDWNVFKHSWKDWRWVLAPLSSLLAIGAWLVPMIVLTVGSSEPGLSAYRDNILLHQTITRYANAWGHIQPPWYLLTHAAPWLWMPVTLLLPWLFPTWWRDLKAKNSAVLLLASWIVLVLLFFSISDGKRSLYIFPAAPALALLAGAHAKELLQRIGVQRVLVAAPAIPAIGLVVVAMYVAMNPHNLGQWVTDATTILKASGSLLAIGFAMLVAVLFCRRRHALAGFATAMVVFWVGTGLLLAPSINSVRSGAALIERVEGIIGSESEVGFVGWKEQFLLQSERPVTHFGYRRADHDGEINDALHWLAKDNGRVLLIAKHRMTSCFDENKIKDLGVAHRQHWVLAGVDSVDASCLANIDDTPQVVFHYHPPRNKRQAEHVKSASLGSLLGPD